MKSVLLAFLTLAPMALVSLGQTDKPPAELTSQNRAWNFAPAVTDTNGCISLGCEKRERAFKFVKTGASVSFKLQASKKQPLAPRAFVIASWGSADCNVSLKVNSQAKKRGVGFRAGIEVDTDGSNTLVIWLPLSAAETVSFGIGDGK